MGRSLATIAAVMFLCAPAVLARDLSEAQIRQAIIKESIAEYQSDGHPCACPYNHTRTGRSCGRRSAYNRPGGAAPLCYPKDVTSGMVRDWRGRHPQ